MISLVRYALSTRTNFIYLIIISFFLGTSAFAAETNASSDNLSLRIKKACAEKKIDDRLNALVNIAKTLSPSEIPTAIRTADDLKQLRERVVFKESALRRWAEIAPAEAFAYIADLPESTLKVETIRSVAPAYAKKDIHAATAAAVKMNPGRARNEAVQLIAETWAKEDANAAIKWVNNLPDGFPKDMALHDIYFIWVHLDPAGISSTVQNLPPGDMKNALLMNVAGDWAAQDPANAVKWAEALPLQPDKELALATAAESWADVDPSAAAEFALKLSPSDLKQRAVAAALERWATQNPQQAWSWILKVPDENLQGPGLTRILNIFVPVSPEAAGRWVDQLPAGPLRENAIGTYVETVRLWNPGAGAALALKTSDPAERQRRVEQCFVLWLAWDPDSAKRWLAQTSFPAEIKGHWLSEKPEL